MIRTLRKEPPNVIHFQGFSLIANNWTIRRFVKSPSVVTLHGLYEGLETIQRHPFSHLVSRTVSRYLRGFDRIILLSEKDRELLRIFRLPDERLVVVGNGVHENVFNNYHTRANDTPQILCVARFDVNKGHLDLLSALSAILRLGMRFKAFLVGPIGDMAYAQVVLSQIALDGLSYNVIVSFNATDEAVAELYRKCDIFVLPSHKETSPLVVLEAIASGLAVVATQTGAVDDLLSDGEEGFLVQPQQPHTLARRLSILLINEGLRRRFSRAAVARTRSRTWKRAAEETIRIYREIQQPRVD
jgi:glycosyltransferase involved in cell wall biosynthesis